MTKRKVIKIIIAILIAITLFVSLSQNSFSFIDDISTKFDGKNDRSNTTSTVGTIFGQVLNFIQVVAMGFAVVMLITIAIRWIGASPSGKAEMKKAVTYYILGAIFIFAAVGLLQIIKNFANKASEEI